MISHMVLRRIDIAPVKVATEFSHSLLELCNGRLTCLRLAERPLSTHLRHQPESHACPLPRCRSARSNDRGGRNPEWLELAGSGMAVLACSPLGSGRSMGANRTAVRP